MPEVYIPIQGLLPFLLRNEVKERCDIPMDIPLKLEKQDAFRRTFPSQDSIRGIELPSKESGRCETALMNFRRFIVEGKSRTSGS